MHYQRFATILFGLISVLELCDSSVTINPKSETRIIGGYEVWDIADVPYLVSVQYQGSHFCGGSLLSQQWVLTAAHCTIRRSASELCIRGGSLRHAQGGIVLQVKKIVEHPQYDYQTNDYDFSLIQLMPWYNSYVDVNFEPARLPYQGEDVPDGTFLEVFGWGGDENHHQMSPTLYAAYMWKFNQQKCNGSEAYQGEITDRMICASSFGGSVESCYGDGGGPLEWNGKLVGVVSWGRGCALKNYPNVYARVSSVRYWIYCVTNL